MGVFPLKGPHGRMHEKMHPAWRPGQSGNPAGRPKSARSKFSEAFLRDAYEVWLTHGKKALQATAENHPVEYLKLIVSLLPKEDHITESPMEGLTYDELGEIIEAIRAVKNQCTEKAQPTRGGMKQAIEPADTREAA
jgi:hypothetical protein